MSAPPPEPPTPAPPPRPGLRHQVATRWARRYALGRLPFWLLTRAAFLLALCAVLFATNGMLLGWADAYDVLIGITSPAEADSQWAAWPLSVVGWAAIPAFVGGTVGYLVTVQIQAHQSRDFDAMMDELRVLIQPPPGPGDDA
ncbi:DUF6313 family protein [Streptomyces sp. NPDC059513]|uniref:DUF6313 family protein n=1 Tax=unclassified Streptomyces TaxID=2593676 RepID=UPI0036CDB9D9